MRRHANSKVILLTITQIMLTIRKLKGHSSDCIETRRLFCWEYANDTSVIQMIVIWMVCLNISSAAYNSSSQSAPHFYAGPAMGPSICCRDYWCLLIGCEGFCIGFWVIPGKRSAFLSEGVFSSLKT